jgi:HK97 family phage major capsid protein
LPREELGNPSALRAFPQSREGQEAAYASGMYYKAIGLQDKRAQAWCEQRGMFTRTMTEGVFSSGGNLAPVAVAADLVRNVETFSLARQVCRRWPMTTAALEIPVQSSGVTASFVSESDATTESAPTSTNVTLTAKELACMTTVSKSLLEDSAVSVGDWLTMVFSTAVAQKEEQCLFIGDGTSTYGGMRGAVTKILDSSYAGSRFATPSGEDTFSEFTNTSLAGLMAVCPENSKSAPGAGWFCSSTFKDSVFTRLALAAGGNDTSSLREGVGMRFGGYPIYVTSVMKSDATEDLTGLCPLLFGNMGRAAAFGAGPWPSWPSLRGRYRIEDPRYVRGRLLKQRCEKSEHQKEEPKACASGPPSPAIR